MAKKLKKSSDIKIKKKKWVQIISPGFNNHVLGETTVVDSKQALKKDIQINLMQLIGDPRKQSINIHFNVEKVKSDTSVIAEVVGYTMQHPALRKLVRRGKTKIQDSFKCYTADKKPITIKPFILTRFLVNKNVSRKIRGMVKLALIQEASKRTFIDLINDVISSKIQNSLKKEGAKIYPIRVLEFSAIEILNNTKGKFEEPSVELEEKVYSKSEKKTKAPETDEEPEKEEQAEAVKEPKKSKEEAKE